MMQEPYPKWPVTIRRRVLNRMKADEARMANKIQDETAANPVLVDPTVAKKWVKNIFRPALAGVMAEQEAAITASVPASAPVKGQCEKCGKVIGRGISAHRKACK